MARCLPLILLLAGLGITVLGARDFTAYRVGDVVDGDIVTPVALNVMDPVATDALKSSEALKIPAIFRSDPGVTNGLAAQFQVAFDSARSNFISALQETFHQTVLDHALIASPDFGYLVTAFNIDNKKFPIPAVLAMDWAYGKDGAHEKAQWLNSLLEVMHYSIRPDDLPAGFNLGETVRLVPVTGPDEKLTPDDASTRGQTVAAANLATLAQVRMQFRRVFTDYDEQPTARALAAWLQPNCLPDAVLTQSAREESVRQLVVGEYYTAGQIIAPKGSVVDAKIKSALDELSATAAANLAAAAPMRQPSEPPGASVTPASTLPPAIPPTLTISTPEDQIKPPVKSGPVVNAAVITPQPVAAKISHISSWPLASAAFAVAILALVVGRVGMRRGRAWGRALPATPLVKDMAVELKNSHLLQTELAPQLVRIVRQAFVHELAGQRRDLLVAQQAAAAEVIRLVYRMDELQVVMQERLRTYESQIRNLEAELTARTEENRQLIRLKIQMIRHQVEAENGAKRVEFN